MIMKIPSLERRVFWFSWIAAVFWNGILVFGTIRSGFPYHGLKDLPALIFPAIGIALLLWAIRQAVLWSIYGQTYFVSDADSFPLGGTLDGKIQFSRSTPFASVRRFRLKLNYQIGTGKNSTVAWSDSRAVDMAPDGTIPILFRLPAEAKPKAFVLSGVPIKWDLQVKEIKGGIKSFAAEYILPSAEETYDFFHLRNRMTQ
jgi:hypothetical protein